MAVLLLRGQPYAPTSGLCLPLGDIHSPVMILKRAVTRGRAHVQPASVSSSNVAPKVLVFAEALLTSQGTAGTVLSKHPPEPAGVQPGHLGL